jgi:hypothetical protein
MKKIGMLAAVRFIEQGFVTMVQNTKRFYGTKKNDLFFYLGIVPLGRSVI